MISSLMMPFRLTVALWATRPDGLVDGTRPELDAFAYSAYLPVAIPREHS